MKADLSGLKRTLDRSARELRRAAGRAVAEGAEMLANRVRINAPFETGALRDSVSTEAGKSTRGRAVALVVVEGGHGDEPVALDVEYGTLHQSPDPFVRRSVTQLNKPVRAHIRAAVRNAFPGD